MSAGTSQADISIKLGMSGCYVTRVECQKVRKKEKIVMFDLMVHWSDERKAEITRKYSVVFDFMNMLKGIYSSTVIPELKSGKWFESLFTAKKEQKKAVEEFFQKILNLPEAVGHGKEVCEFFSWPDESEPEPQVQPVIDSHSIEGDYETVDRDCDGYHTLSIKPKIISVYNRKEQLDDSSSVYWAVTEYCKRKSGEVDLTEGASVSVLQRELSGWWFVHVENTSEEGWAPASCLLPVDRNNLDSGKVSGPFGVFQTLKDFVASEPDEISCRKGETVEVIEAFFDGWWVIRYKDKVGKIPATNLEPISNERRLRSSLYHQAGIYKKYSPPPRRNSKVTVEELYGKVDKFRKFPPAQTVAISKDSDEDPEYAEVEFDRKIPSSNYKPTEAVDLNSKLDKRPEESEEEEEDSAFYMNALEDSRRAYVNVELKPSKKPQKHELKYYKVKKRFAPIVKHQGRPLLPAEVGDIVESHIEETEEIFAKIFRLANGAHSAPREGWIQKNHVEPYELGPGDSLVAEPTPTSKPVPQAPKQPPHSDAKSSQPRRPSPTAAKPKPVADAKLKPTPPPRQLDIESKSHHQTPIRSQQSCALPERNAAGKAPADVAEQSKRSVSLGSPTKPEPPATPKQNPLSQVGNSPSQDASSEVEKFTIRKFSRTECENVLLKSATQRQFVIRESTKVGHYALSVRSADRIHHFPIELTTEKKYFIGRYNFDSLQDVIKYYKHNPVFELEDGTGITLESSLET